MDFRRDPFDVLRVPIIIELEPLWTSKQEIDLRLLPEPSNNNLVGSLGSLSGYQIKEARFTPYMNRSDNSMGTWTRPQFSQVRLEITYQSNLWPGIVNWIIPDDHQFHRLDGTFCGRNTLGCSLGHPLNSPAHPDFLQQSYHSSLPKLTYTTFLDDLFTLSHLIAMALFGLFT